MWSMDHTHPHRDHAGAFTEIYKDPKKLKIDKVYAVDMASPELCLENAPWMKQKCMNNGCS